MRAYFLIMLLFCCGCTGVETGSARHETTAILSGKIAIIPFENLSTTPHAGQILAEFMQAELYTAGHLSLSSTDQVQRALRTKDALPDQDILISPAALGKKLDVSYLLLGRVTEYAYRQGVGQEPAIGLSLRLVEASTGRVVWRKARSRTGQYFIGHENSLSELGQSISKQLAQSLVGLLSVHD